MEAKLYGQNKGGMSINGIIKDYYAYAGENISAGDLVEYVNGVAGRTDLGESVDTQLSTSTNTGYTISAVALDESRVFIAHSHGSDYYLYGMVVSIDGTTITKGSDTAIVGAAYAGYSISTCLLPNGNVFIAHSHSSNRYLYGIVVSISETTISKGSDTSLVGSSYSGFAISTCLLPNGKVFIAHTYDKSSNYLYGIVVSISETTISKGSDTAIVSSTYAGYSISTCLLPNGNVFIAHSRASNYYLYGIVCSISGTTITAGSDTALNNSTANTGSAISTCLLPNGNVFIAHSYSASMYLYKMVVSISGTTITKGTDLTLGPANDGHAISTCLLPNGNVFVASSYDTDYYLRGRIVSGAGTELSYSTLIKSKYAGSKISSLLLNNGTIFIAHSDSSSYYLNAQIWGVDENNTLTNRIIADEYETQVRKVTTGQFDGVAKTNGTGGDDTGHNEVVSIWTLGATQEFTMADGNTMYDANGDIFLVREAS